MENLTLAFALRNKSLFRVWGNAWCQIRLSNVSYIVATPDVYTIFWLNRITIEPALTGAEGLEPATAGFGNQCSTD